MNERLILYFSPSMPLSPGCFVVITITAVLYKLWTCRKLNFSFYFLGSCVGLSVSNGESVMGRREGAARDGWGWKKVTAIRARALNCVVPEIRSLPAKIIRDGRVTIGERGTISKVDIVWVLPIFYCYTEYKICWKIFFQNVFTNTALLLDTYLNF